MPLVVLVDRVVPGPDGSEGVHVGHALAEGGEGPVVAPLPVPVELHHEVVAAHLLLVGEARLEDRGRGDLCRRVLDVLPIVHKLLHEGHAGGVGHLGLLGGYALVRVPQHLHHVAQDGARGDAGHLPLEAVQNSHLHSLNVRRVEGQALPHELLQGLERGDGHLGHLGRDGDAGDPDQGEQHLLVLLHAVHGQEPVQDVHRREEGRIVVVQLLAYVGHAGDHLPPVGEHVLAPLGPDLVHVRHELQLLGAHGLQGLAALQGGDGSEGDPVEGGPAEGGRAHVQVAHRVGGPRAFHVLEILEAHGVLRAAQDALREHIVLRVVCGLQSSGKTPRTDSQRHRRPREHESASGFNGIDRRRSRSSART
mmetsp:Transcript_6914/g.20201  ORF Transcript_6914/g.20201 Transcript_6914/m.20201 type:complete len:365 (-) Transcript_6914:302-1396(-)